MRSLLNLILIQITRSKVTVTPSSKMLCNLVQDSITLEISHTHKPKSQEIQEGQTETPQICTVCYLRELLKI